MLKRARSEGVASMLSADWMRFSNICQVLMLLIRNIKNRIFRFAAILQVLCSYVVYAYFVNYSTLYNTYFVRLWISEITKYGYIDRTRVPFEVHLQVIISINKIVQIDDFARIFHRQSVGNQADKVTCVNFKLP